MKLIIDTVQKTLDVIENECVVSYDLYSKCAFELISRQWLKVGWNEKYTYTFSWFGLPVIQLPEDMIRMQEVVYQIKPDVIIETGIAHGGSLIFYASMCKAMGKGRVVGVDIEIRPHNLNAIENHDLFPYITLIEGHSTAADVIEKVKSHIGHDEKVMVVLDSCHTREHVFRELAVYSRFVSKGSYIIATDGIMSDLYDVPRGKPEWVNDNPAQAVTDFLNKNQEFILLEPGFIFNESQLDKKVTHWPGAWLKRKE